MEAYLRAGRTDAAASALAVFQRQAEQTGRTWALASAARCRGMTAAEDGFEHEFAEAIRWHERTPTPFERARTELHLGERLRRARHPGEARLPLRSALEAFERLGAVPWADQARTELAAAGERPQHRPQSGLERLLTPQELQIALIIAKGTRNREAAAALFLSPKTIEFHLGKIYRKLGIRSGTELALLVAAKTELVETA